MSNKKNTIEHLETVAELRKSMKQSPLTRAKVKLLTGIGRSKRYVHDYKLPVVATGVFLIFIMSVAVIRQFQRTSILSLINEATNGSADYATLLSTDQSDEFTRENTDEPERAGGASITSSGDSTQSTSTSFTLNNDETPTSISTSSNSSNDADSSDSGGSNGSGGDDTSDNEDPPVIPFTASISGFNQGNTTLDCRNPSKPNVGSCSKIYSFNARVATSNGPGSVTYTWQSSQGSSSGSISAGEGSAITAVTRNISLACNKSTTFTIQFNITSPTLSNSNILTINHNCNEL